MKEIIDKHTLAYEKSTFGLKLIKISHKSFYVDITHTIHSAEVSSSIKISPSALPDIIEALEGYKQILDESPIDHPKYISEANEHVIQYRYLKGVSIEDIALQMGKTVQLIEKVLRNRDIEIVPNKLPDKYLVSKVPRRRGYKKK